MRRLIAFVDHEIGFRLLESLLSRAVGDLELAAVVTTEDNGKHWWPGVEDLCRAKGLPLHRYREPFDDAARYADIDWYLLLSWKHVLPAELVARPKLGVINLHYSLLPEYRGVYPVNWALMEGKAETGVSFHLVDEHLDGGPLVAQRAVPILPTDTARSLQLRLDEVAWELFDELLVRIGKARTADELRIAGAGRAASYRSKEDFLRCNELDLTRSYTGAELLNLFRGKSFLPQSRLLYFIDPASGERVYVRVALDAEP